jgi:hypothetical protein
VEKAKNFAPGADEEGDCCMDEITLPAGIRVLPLIYSLSFNNEELEMLLPKNTSFTLKRVEEASESKHGLKTYHWRVNQLKLKF